MINIFHSVKVVIDRLYLIVLLRIFKFNPWHAQAPASARAYRYTVAQVVNDCRPTTVVEVGCGLGYILALINAPLRHGYDVDGAAIRAARFLHRGAIGFVHGDLSSVSENQIDVLILVNWIHEISPATLDALLAPLLPRTKYLLLDAIDPDESSGYRFKHNFSFLESRARRVSVTRPHGEGRSFHLFEVIA